MSRLWVRISNCSRLLRSMCGDRSTVYRSMRVGSGIGPWTSAPRVLGGLHDLGRGAVEHLVVVRLPSGCGCVRWSDRPRDDSLATSPSIAQRRTGKVKQ